MVLKTTFLVTMVMLWRASPPADHNTIGCGGIRRRTGVRRRSGQWDARLCRCGDRDGLISLSLLHLFSPLDSWFSVSYELPLGRAWIPHKDMLTQAYPMFVWILRK